MTMANDMSFQDEAVEVAADYEENLTELSFNSKPVINSLTMIAEENTVHSKTIARVIEKKILTSSSDQKLPSLYLLDSICKNVGGSYLEHFKDNLCAAVSATYKTGDNKVQESIRRLVKTWTGYFDPDLIVEIYNQLSLIDSLGGGRKRSAPLMEHSTAKKAWQPQQQPQQPSHFGQQQQHSFHRHMPHTQSHMQYASAEQLSLQNEIATKLALVKQFSDGNSNMPIPELLHLVSDLSQLLQIQLETYPPSDPYDYQQIVVTLRQLEMVKSKQSDYLLQQRQLDYMMQQQPPLYNYQGLPPQPYQQQLKPEPELPPATMSAADLFASLQGMGVITSAALASGSGSTPPSAFSSAGEVPPPAKPQKLPFIVSSVREESVVASMYGDSRKQCTTCGKRFESGDEQGLREHMDWHFSSNKRKQKGVTSSRTWMPSSDEWGMPHSDAAANQASSSIVSFFDNENDNSNNGDELVQMPNQSQKFVVPCSLAGDGIEKCQLCGEDLEQIWDVQGEEWVWKDTVLVPAEDGSATQCLCHAKCHISDINNGDFQEA